MKEFKFFGTEETDFNGFYKNILGHLQDEDKKFMSEMLYALYTFVYDDEYMNRTTYKSKYGMVKLLKNECVGRTQNVVISIKPKGDDAVKVFKFRYNYAAENNLVALVWSKTFNGKGINIRNVVNLI